MGFARGEIHVTSLRRLLSDYDNAGGHCEHVLENEGESIKWRPSLQLLQSA